MELSFFKQCFNLVKIPLLSRQTQCALQRYEISSVFHLRPHAHSLLEKMGTGNPNLKLPLS